MADWYGCLNPWNRMVLTGLLLVLVIRAALGNLTVELTL